MKRLAIYTALLLPLIGLGLWSAFPQADPSFATPLFHFYIVTFTTLAATVVSLFVVISVGETALPRHLLLAAAFVWMGAVFFIHGFTTPGALITHFHPAITVSSWLTLFGGGVLFLAAAFAPSAPSPLWLRATALSLLLAYAAYAGVVIFAPGLLTALLSLRSTPTVSDVIFAVSLAVWLAATLRHYRNYRETRHFVDGLMAFESFWFFVATVSLFRRPLWAASWWLYHVLLLLGFLIATVALWRAYEQIRSFRLTRYYAAASLIVTAALALLSAEVYARFVFQRLLEQLESSTLVLSQGLASALSADLPQVETAEDLRSLDPARDLDGLMRQHLPLMNTLSALDLYDASGFAVYRSPASRAALGAVPLSFVSLTEFQEFQATLAGATSVHMFEPGAAPSAYAPSQQVHVVQAYVPVRPHGDAQATPIGVLVTWREVPELTQAVIASRGTGLTLAAFSLGGLFVALLFIVRRADQLISHRTRELERAYTDLQQAEGLRDDLTRMIVHDLRNPLTAITANLDLLGKTINNPAYANAPARFLGSARASGQRMVGMIDDLLNVSKFEAGELRPDLTPVYLPTLLAEKEEVYRIQAERENKVFSVHAPPELPTVMADGSLIGRVIDNLVSNAFKYTEPGGTIAVSVERDDHTLFVRVRDDGQGILPQYHARIFEKFVQVTDADGQPLRKGTGLGLAFCKLAVQAHQGTIWVESAPGKGSTFSFGLPLARN